MTNLDLIDNKLQVSWPKMALIEPTGERGSPFSVSRYQSHQQSKAKLV